MMTPAIGGRRISLDVARKLARLVGVLIWTCPEPYLPESDQYALVFDVEERILELM